MLNIHVALSGKLTTPESNMLLNAYEQNRQHSSPAGLLFCFSGLLSQPDLVISGCSAGDQFTGTFAAARNPAGCPLNGIEFE